MTIPPGVRRLLWEYDLDRVDLPDELPDAVIERVMARGGWSEMQWLIHEIGLVRLRSVLDRRGARTLLPREIAFWGFACSAPDDLVQDWINEARNRQRQWQG